MPSWLREPTLRRNARDVRKPAKISRQRANDDATSNYCNRLVAVLTQSAAYRP